MSREDLLFQERIDPNHDQDLVLRITLMGARRKYDLVKRYTSPSDKVLDIGCGYGWGSYELSEKAFFVLGIDSDSDTISIAVQRYGNKENLQFKEMTRINGELDNNTFDLVSCVEVIEHVNDPHSLLENTYRVLKRGGKLIITTPNGTNTMHDGVPGHQAHIKEYSVEEMKQLLVQTGFSLDNMYGQYIPFGILMRFLGSNINHSNNPQTGTLQKALDAIPLLADLSSRFCPYWLYASKSIAYIAHKPTAE